MINSRWERDVHIRAEVAAGRTLQSVANEFGITRQRAHQIAGKHREREPVPEAAILAAVKAMPSDSGVEIAAKCGTSPRRVYDVLTRHGYVRLWARIVTLDGPEGSSETIYPTEEGQ